MPVEEILFSISKSGLLEMGICHGNCGNTVLHIVIGEGGRESEGLSLKIQPYVEDLFLAYLLHILTDD
jgi:hypothetical protein